MEIDYKNSWYESFKPNYKSFDEHCPAYWELKYCDRWIEILTQLDKRATDKGIEVLDIGCGLGRALSHFKNYNAKVTGVEPSLYACENNRLDKDELINDYFENITLYNKFDVIHVEQVLSHIPCYKETLRKALDYLKQDGVMVIEEPNDFNPLQERLAYKKGEYWITDDHCNYFSHSKMEKVLKDLGCEVMYKTCTFPMEFFEMMGDEYIGNDIAGKRVHKKRFELLKAMGFNLRRKFLEKCAEMDIGRDIVVYVKKGVKNG